MRRWTYPKVDMASVEEGRMALGGLAGKRQKTRLEEEIMLVTSRVGLSSLLLPVETCNAGRRCEFQFSASSPIRK